MGSRFNTVVSFAAGLTLGLALLAVSVVHAQQGQQGQQPAAPPPGGPSCHPDQVQPLLSGFGLQLGHALGASDDQIQAAMQQVAQQMLPHIESQVQAICGLGQGGGNISAAVPIPPQALLGAAAQALGTDPDTVRGELQQGRTLSEIAQAQGVDPDALADQLTQAAEQIRVQEERAAIRHLMDQTIGRPGGSGQ